MPQIEIAWQYTWQSALYRTRWYPLETLLRGGRNPLRESFVENGLDPADISKSGYAPTLLRRTYSDGRVEVGEFNKMCDLLPWSPFDGWPPIRVRAAK